MLRHFPSELYNRFGGLHEASSRRSLASPQISSAAQAWVRWAVRAPGAAVGMWKVELTLHPLALDSRERGPVALSGDARAGGAGRRGESWRTGGELTTSRPRLVGPSLPSQH